MLEGIYIAQPNLSELAHKIIASRILCFLLQNKVRNIACTAHLLVLVVVNSSLNFEIKSFYHKKTNLSMAVGKRY